MLNRITAAELAGLFAEARFDALEATVRNTLQSPPAHLLETYRSEALKAEELMFVHRPGIGKRRAIRQKWPDLLRSVKSRLMR